MSQQTNADAIVLREILAAIEQGTCPTLEPDKDAIQALYEEMLAADAAGTDSESALETIAADDPTLFGKLVLAMVSIAIGFVDDEKRKYEEIRMQRPLTDSEKRYGNEQLRGILVRVQELLQKVKSR